MIAQIPQFRAAGGAECARRSRAGAMTLIELVISLTLLSIIMAGMGSVLMLAGKGMKVASSGAGASAGAARGVADQIAADLKMATSFSERTSTAATFVVPDRSGVIQPTVRYAWSGAAGSTITNTSGTYTIAPYTITREFNGGRPSVLGSNVQAFQLNYLTRTIGAPPPPPPVEGSEQVIASHTSLLGLLNNAFSVGNLNWPAEYFSTAALKPLNTISWKITRIQLSLKKIASSGTLTIQVQSVNANHLPTGKVLGSATVSVGTLGSSAAWVNIPFANLGNLDPNSGIAIVVTGSASSVAAAYYDPLSLDLTLGYMTTTTGGASWSGPTSLNAMEFYVYGTYTTQPPAPAWSEPPATLQ